jgi:hypothetical protein
MICAVADKIACETTVVDMVSNLIGEVILVLYVLVEQYILLHLALTGAGHLRCQKSQTVGIGHGLRNASLECQILLTSASIQPRKV